MNFDKILSIIVWGVFGLGCAWITLMTIYVQFTIFNNTKDLPLVFDILHFILIGIMFMISISAFNQMIREFSNKSEEIDN